MGKHRLRARYRGTLQRRWFEEKRYGTWINLARLSLAGTVFPLAKMITLVVGNRPENAGALMLGWLAALIVTLLLAYLFTKQAQKADRRYMAFDRQLPIPLQHRSPDRLWIFN